MKVRLGRHKLEARLSNKARSYLNKKQKTKNKKQKTRENKT